MHKLKLSLTLYLIIKFISKHRYQILLGKALSPLTYLYSEIGHTKKVATEIINIYDYVKTNFSSVASPARPSHLFPTIAPLQNHVRTTLIGPTVTDKVS